MTCDIPLKNAFLMLVLIIPLQTYAATAFYRSSKCAEPVVKQDLEISKMIGDWFEIYSFPSAWSDGRCMQISYRWTDQRDTVQVYWQQILENGTISNAISYAKASSDDKFDAKLSLNFTKPKVAYPVPFWIVDTDYDNYTIAYSCYPVYHPILKTYYNAELAWILSRRRTMDRQEARKMKNTLTKYGVFTQMFTINDQTNCAQYN